MSKPEPSAVGRIVEAAAFAAEKHQFHRRKDADATPYINHPLRAAQILTESGVDEVDVIAAALLHDTIEDTETSYEELLERFGSSVAGMVREITDDKGLEKQERKERQVTSAPHKSDGAKLVKLADKSANLEDLISCPPSNWSRDRIQEYRRWAQRVADGCSGVNAALDQRVADLTAVGDHGGHDGRS